MRWAIFGAVVLAAILVPFALFEAEVAAATGVLVSAERPRAAVTAGVIGLLALDVVLPVPSSIVSTAAGSLLGIPLGIATTWLGMSAGCALGYALGRAGRPVLGRGDLARGEAAARRFGDWAIVACRAVPVLAEASVIVAGAARMPLARFALLCGLSNLAIAAVYGTLGGLAAGTGSFALAFAASVIVPAIAIGFSRRSRLRSSG